MGATGWVERVAWRADLQAALDEARARAYALIPEQERQAAEATPVSQLIEALDIDPDDPDNEGAWRAWLARVGPETRFAVSRSPDGTGSVLDVDHVDHVVRAALRPGRVVDLAAARWALQAPSPGLAALRPATDDELLAWFETTTPTRAQVDDWAIESVLDSLERGSCVAIPIFGATDPEELVLVGVTGD